MTSDVQQARIETLTGALAQRDASLKIAHLTIDKLTLELSNRLAMAPHGR